MIEILNTWNSKPLKRVYYTVNESDLKYTNGDYKIYHQFKDCYLYTFKNIAINQLAGLNKEHLDNLAKGIDQPENNFLYHRALETKQKGIELLNN